MFECRIESHHCAHYSVSGQDLFKADIDLSKPWNPGNAVPVEDWLTDCFTPEDADRLKCMGNIVVPVQARKALSVLTKIHSLNRE